MVMVMVGELDGIGDQGPSSAADDEETERMLIVQQQITMRTAAVCMNFPSHYLKASIGTDDLWLETETMIPDCVNSVCVHALKASFFGGGVSC